MLRIIYFIVSHTEQNCNHLTKIWCRISFLEFCTFFIWRKYNVRIPIRNKANCGLSALPDL